MYQALSRYDRFAVLLAQEKTKEGAEMKVTKKQVIEWAVSFALIAAGVIILICLAVQEVSYTVYVPILMVAIALATGLIVSY